MKYNVTHSEVNLERMLAFYKEEYRKNPCHNFYMLEIIKVDKGGIKCFSQNQ